MLCKLLSCSFSASLSFFLPVLLSVSDTTALSDLNFVGSSFGVPGNNVSFDYIIAGGGTAGLVVAARLAQNASNSVAVIEAGGFYEVDNGNLSVVPGTDTYFAGADPDDTNPLIDWGFVTAPQPGLDGRNVHYARGKCLGGSSARNYLAYQRGTRDSYDLWAKQVDDDSYSFKSFLPFLARSVNFTPPNNGTRAENASVPYNPSAFMSGGGPLHVTSPNHGNQWDSYISAGLDKLGMRQALDFVSGSLFGHQYNMQTLDPRDMTRSSSESSFLRAALLQGHGNLQVYKNTLAKKVVFDGTRAVGVDVSTSGLAYRLSANKEVILSAGTFQSPQLLMVSGVGPKNTLQDHNIPIVSSLPGVGQNMWDHFLAGPSYRVNVPTHSVLGNPSLLAAATAEYITNHTGVLTNNGGDFFGWEKLPDEERNSQLSNDTRDKLAAFPADWPELEYITLDAYVGDQENYVMGQPKTPYMYASVIAAIVAPLSRGNVTISSPDTNDLPIISPNWLVDKADQEVMVAGYKRVRALVDTDEVQRAVVGDELYPGRNVTSDEDILDAIKKSGLTVWHASSTCKMGRPDDDMAVVDTHARVYGTQGLRVVDASAFPFLPPGHPQATIYGFAEKIVRDIMRGG